MSTSRRRNVLHTLFRRQLQSVETWESSLLLRYYEETVVNCMTKEEEDKGLVVVKEVFNGSKSIQAVAFSDNGHYMATGHSSRHHEVLIHSLRPKIHTLCKLVGHPHTPWCLTFDPFHQHILYSGCLGGIVNKWNVKNRCLISNFCPMITITSIVPLPSMPGKLLIATKHALYLVTSEGMGELWKVKVKKGLLRQVKCQPHTTRIVTAVTNSHVTFSCKLRRGILSFRIQLYDLSSDNRPDFDDVSQGLVTNDCSPYCTVLTENFIICCVGQCSLLIADSFGRHIHTVPFQHSWLPGVSEFFMDVSPCKRFLLRPVKSGKLFILDLESYQWKCVKNIKSEIHNHLHQEINFGMWMPLVSGHAMDVCIGSIKGSLFLCSTIIR